MPVLNESASFLVSTIVSILLFSGMQMGKALLTSTPAFTIIGGFVGSILFVFLLTAVANLEKTVFGNNFQAKLGEKSWPGILSGHPLCQHFGPILFFRQKFYNNVTK